MHRIKGKAFIWNHLSNLLFYKQVNVVHVLINFKFSTNHTDLHCEYLKHYPAMFLIFGKFTCSLQTNLHIPGGSIKSKWTKSSIPSFLSCKTTEPRFERRISGYVLSCISCLNAFSVYSRKHLPGLVRPALPALCWAEALLMGETRRDSTRIRGL